jgi:hypothetical protein
VLSLIGNIIRRGQPEKTKALRLILHGFTKSHNVGVSRYIHNSSVGEQSAGPPAIEAHNGSGERLPSPSSTPAEEEDDLIDISQYTMTLKEHCDRSGTVLSYEGTRVSFNPPLFRESISIKGEKVTGEGRNKKLAKHRASKLACAALGLLPS